MVEAVNQVFMKQSNQLLKYFRIIPLRLSAFAVNSISFFPKPTLYFLAPYLTLLITGALLLFYGNDQQIFLLLNRLHHPLLDVFFKYYTLTGSGYFFILVCLVFFFIDKKKAILLFISFVIISLLVQSLKHFIFDDATRPYKFFEDLYSLHLVDGVFMNRENSFPSGHATSAFALTCMLSLFFRNKPISFLLLISAVLSGYSRIYLAQHFFSDVYAGSLIGVIISLIVWWIFNDRFKKYQ